MIRVLTASASLLLLAGCTHGYDYNRYPDRQPWTVTHNGEEIDYELLDRVLFDTDSAEISQRAYHVIADIAAEARHHPHSPIVVDGYTDTVGTPEHNLDLSRARAESVADVLVHEGIPSGQIATHGFGETHLAVPTGDQVEERRNRRVVIRILPPV